jgi:general secretion pathway protein N
MRPATLVLLAGALALVAGAAWRWPARALVPLLPAGVACERVGGTLWNGHCAGLSTGGRPLGTARWQLQPGPLLLGRLSTRLQFDTPGGRISGGLTVHLGGWLEAGPVSADLDLRRAQLPGLPADLGGRVVAELPSLAWSGGTLSELTGRIEATGLVRGDAAPLRLGSYELVFEPPAAGRPPTARVQDLGGPLWVRATLAWVPPAGYLLEGQVQARDEASEPLRRELERLGPADAQGRRRFAQEASL